MLEINDADLQHISVDSKIAVLEKAAKKLEQYFSDDRIRRILPHTKSRRK